MSDVVLDASAAVRLLLGRPSPSREASRLIAEAGRVQVPRLFYSEVANALWKYVQGGYLDEVTALERLREARELVESPLADESLVDEALATAVRFGHPVYDAVYAVLARRTNSTVVTVDRRLERLLHALRIGVVG